MTDTSAIEHLREINIRLSERIERLESELIKERAHSRRLTDTIIDKRSNKLDRPIYAGPVPA